MIRKLLIGGTGVLLSGTFFRQWHSKQPRPMTKEWVDEQKSTNDKLPIDTECRMTMAPNVPPPIKRREPARVVVKMTSESITAPLAYGETYPFWTFNESVPGPFIRTRVGDVLEVHYTNNDETGVAHNIDFHGVTGPGGGAALTLAEKGEEKVVEFKMLHAGLFVYHCAAAPVPVHVQNGMYGLLLVEPEAGLPPVDKEFYVMQSEFYANLEQGSKTALEPSYQDGLDENPKYVVFNGRVGSLTDKPLMAEQGDKVRFYFGNAGPNLISSFHVIGLIFDKVYREGDLISAPARSIQTTLVPAGGAAVIDTECPVPGNFTLVDHSIFRLDKGAVGFLKVAGIPRTDVYGEILVAIPGIVFLKIDRPNPCPGFAVNSR